MEKCDF